MNQIDFEKDQEEVLERTKNISKLADKVKELQGMEKSIEVLEESLKKTNSPYSFAPIILILGRPSLVPGISCII